MIDSGQAAVSIKGRCARILGPGDYFGEIALIDEGPRTATIRASTELVCFGLTHWDFGPLVEANGAMIGWKLLQTTAKMLRAERQEYSPSTTSA